MMHSESLLALGWGTGIVVGVLVILVLIIVGIYNGLVRKRTKVRAAWSQIDVQLKRRHNLIPNLVETVKGYMGHERETLETVIRARGAAMGNQGSNPRLRARTC